jgi:hypothetical protein
MEGSQGLDALGRIALHQGRQGAVALGHVACRPELQAGQLHGRRPTPGHHVAQAQVAQGATPRVGRVVAVLPLHLQVHVTGQEIGLQGLTEFAVQVDQGRPQGRRVGRLHALEQIGLGGQGQGFGDEARIQAVIHQQRPEGMAESLGHFQPAPCRSIRSQGQHHPLHVALGRHPSD